MKKTFATIIIFIISVTVCFSQKKGQSIFDCGSDKVMHVPSQDSPLIAFMEKSTELFGFWFSTSDAKIIIEPTYDDVCYDYFKKYRLIVVGLNGRYGAINCYGKVVIDCIYSKNAIDKKVKEYSNN